MWSVGYGRRINTQAAGTQAIQAVLIQISGPGRSSQVQPEVRTAGSMARRGEAGGRAWGYFKSSGSLGGDEASAAV